MERYGTKFECMHGLEETILAMLNLKRECDITSQLCLIKFADFVQQGTEATGFQHS